MIEMRRLKTVAIFFNFKFNAVKKLISIYQFIRVLFVSACLFRNTCMSEIYTSLMHHSALLCMIFAYQKYLHERNTCMYFQKIMTHKSGLQTFLVRVVWIYWLQNIARKYFYYCAPKITEKHSNMGTKANGQKINRRGIETNKETY